MNFIEFSKFIGNTRVIDIRNIHTYFNGFDRRRLYEWQKRGLLLKVVSNFYVMADKPLDDVALRSIATRIYAPAYVGLESALSYYHFIPEAVFRTISITTRRNKLIRTQSGDFQYRSIKPELFFGSTIVANDNAPFFISDPEKTLLDYLYFTPGSDNRTVLAEMRLNLDELRRRIDVRKLSDYLQLFASAKMTKAVHYAMEMTHVEF
jgi:predicted transcriptional regulator of viral defense system